MTPDHRGEKPHESVSDDELREEDVSAGDRLNDRVSEGEGLPEDHDDE